MNINIKLNKNFTTQYNKLQDEFGTDIAKINGFDDGQLSYTDFIDNFVDQKTVADASIDGNSNVSHEVIVYIKELSVYPNIIVKFGRYTPNQDGHYDDVLGVHLASNNQYAERINND